MVLKQRKQKEQNKVTKEDENKKDIKIQEDVISSTRWTFSDVLRNLLKLFFFILVVPAFLNYAALLREEKALKPEGIFIDVKHGQKLYKHCLGSGAPTVILDAPLGHSSDVWSMIAPTLAKWTKVCYYDRAGLGFSQRTLKGMNESLKAGKPHTVERMVEDFHRLFEVEEKPYILVGVDLGALVTKFYTQLYQDYVVGAVLINPLFEGLFLGDENPWHKYWVQSHLPSLQLQHISSALGVTRLGLQTGLFQEPFPYQEASEDVKRRQKYLRCKPSHMSSILEESHFLNESLSQARVMNKLRPYPEQVPTWIIWTDKFSEKISDSRNQIWLKSREMLEKTSGIKPVADARLRAGPPKTFFTQHDRISEIIRKAINRWRDKSTTSY